MDRARGRGNVARRGGQERRVGEVGRKGGEAARLEPPLPLHDRRLLCGQLLLLLTELVQLVNLPIQHRLLLRVHLLA
jgi:hypothetical protein